MRLAPGNGSHVCKPAKVDWCRMVYDGPIAEFPLAIVAPDADRTVNRKRQAVIGSRGNRDDIGQWADLDRDKARGGRAVAQLTGIVKSPCPDRPILEERQAMRITACHGFHI